MTAERSRAYRRVIQTLEDLGPSKLHGHEQARIRAAVDALIFTRDVDADPAARAALRDVERLCGTLVDSGRWQRATALRLVEDVSCCGPPPQELRAA